MEQKKLDRLSELTRKSKTPEGLSEEEINERQILRKEYIEAFKMSLVSQLENTYIVDENGNKKKLEKKKRTTL